MAESQKEFLYLIRDFSNQKTHGDRRVSDLKKHMTDLSFSLDSANSDLSRAKQSRETAEQELKGAQVHLAMTDASILALESRMSNLQDEISMVGSELTALKNQEDSDRDDFIRQMLEMNKKIRDFQAQSVSNENPFVLSPNKEMPESECFDHQIQTLEAECEKEINNHNQLIGELENLRKKITLSAELQRQSEMLEEELRNKYVCPACGVNNMNLLEDSAQN
ncbi:hypothetical protein LUZ60_009370 [Juncus effusus]|nr:hypothetical protein LUZ60_009370 [Juncus effusus]